MTEKTGRSVIVNGFDAVNREQDPKKRGAIALKAVENIAHLRKLRERQGELLDELEYVLLLQGLWELGGTSVEKGMRVQPSFRYEGHRKGYFVLNLFEGKEKVDRQEFPVRFKEGWQMQQWYTPIDIWDETDTVPERLFEIFILNNNPGKSHKAILQEREKRVQWQERLQKRGTDG
jgi:hypothetical protein